jgi:multimeric flavodoxin WrbA
MKILGISGSARKKGNTDILVNKVLSGVAQMGGETELIYLSDYHINECRGCDACKINFECIIKDDMQEIYRKIDEADAIVLGSPTYFYNVSGLVKLFMDRLYLYEIFDKDDRSIWSSVNEINGLKYSVTVAVCEQEKVEDMGVTSEIMVKTLAAVGFKTVCEVKAIHAFKKGDVNSNKKILDEAEFAGIKLVKTINLRNRMK